MTACISNTEEQNVSLAMCNFIWFAFANHDNHYLGILHILATSLDTIGLPGYQTVGESTLCKTKTPDILHCNRRLSMGQVSSTWLPFLH